MSNSDPSRRHERWTPSNASLWSLHSSSKATRAIPDDWLATEPPAKAGTQSNEPMADLSPETANVGLLLLEGLKARLRDTAKAAKGLSQGRLAGRVGTAPHTRPRMHQRKLRGQEKSPQGVAWAHDCKLKLEHKQDVAKETTKSAWSRSGQQKRVEAKLQKHHE